MKALIFILFALQMLNVFGQKDSVNNSGPRVYTHRDSVYLAKLNSNGNLMIAGGVGLCGAGTYLLYQGVKVYTASGTTEEVDRNHRQGTIYLVAGGVGIAGGIVLIAFGAKNKVEFKQRKRRMEMEGGILESGQLGLAMRW